MGNRAINYGAVAYADVESSALTFEDAIFLKQRGRSAAKQCPFLLPDPDSLNRRQWKVCHYILSIVLMYKAQWFSLWVSSFPVRQSLTN